MSSASLLLLGSCLHVSTVAMHVSKFAASFSGSNAANQKCGHVVGFGCCRDDTQSITIEEAAICHPLDHEEIGCSASRLYELHDLIKDCSKYMRINLGMEVVVTHLQTCIDAMNVENRIRDTVGKFKKKKRRRKRNIVRWKKEDIQSW